MTQAPPTKVCKRCGAELGEEYLTCPYDGWQLEALPGDPLLGKIFNGKYEIGSILGKGGMSVVYKAHDLFMERAVAIKILRTQLVCDQNSIDRFRQEGQAAALLDHPNILRVYDFGLTPDDQAFLIMECFEGQTLAQVLDQQGRIAPERALRIMRQICAGLEHAHKKGVVHRDLKPSNLCLVKQEDGTDLVKIVDFGIAKLLPQSGKEKQQLTKTGQIFGSPLFMSPEQCQGKTIDARSDIYSMGCLMYEALTGSPPFMGPTAFDTMHMHVSNSPRPLKKFAPDISITPELENPIMRCLEKDPNKRYQSAAEVTADLPPLPEELAAGQKVWRPSWYASIRHNPVARSTVFLCIGLITPIILFVTLWPGPADDKGTLIEKLIWNIEIQQAEQSMNSGNYTFAKRMLDRAYMLASQKFKDRPKKLTTLQVEMRLGASVSTDPNGEWSNYTQKAFSLYKELITERALADYIAEIAFSDSLVNAKNRENHARQKEIIESRAGHAELVARELDALQLFIYEEKLLQNCLRADKTILGKNWRSDPLSWRIADLNMQLADCYGHMQYTRPIAALLVEALQINESCGSRGPDSPETINTLLRLGQFYRDQSIFTEAGRCLEDGLNRAIAQNEKIKKEDERLSQEYKVAGEQLSQAQSASQTAAIEKKEEEFNKVKARIANLDQRLKASRSLLIEAYNGYADYFNQINKKEKSEENFKAGIELYMAEEQAADAETKGMLESRSSK